MKKGNGQHRDRDAALTLLSIAFVLGTLGGYCAAGRVPAGPYLGGFLQDAAQEVLQPPLWRELWVVFRWPVAVLALSSLPRAGITVPFLFFLRGGFLSYGILSLAAAGRAGACSAALVFGPACLLTLPVLFLLGTEALLRRSQAPAKGQSLHTVACVPVLILCAVLERSMVPALLTGILQTLAQTG